MGDEQGWFLHSNERLIEEEKTERARRQYFQAFVMCLERQFHERAGHFLRYLIGLPSGGALTLRDIRRELALSSAEAREVIDIGIECQVMERYYSYWKISKKAKVWLWHELDQGKI